MNKLLPIHLAIIGVVAVNSAFADVVTSFSDDFSSTTLDSKKWTDISTGHGNGTVSLSEGAVNFGCGTYADTNGKYTFSSNKIVVESRVAGTGDMRDSNISLVDVSTGDRILVGDTNYRGWGSYIYGSGAFNFDPNTDNAKNGATTNAYKEYRLTINGSSLTVERGDSLSNITETRTVTLGSSIVGKTFYLSIGTGGPDYCPATFDWVRVSTSVVKGAVTWSRPPYSVQCKNNTTAQSVSIPRNKKANYDCEKAGLVVNSGDSVTVTVTGNKY
ncbi:MAG: hypothetical protein QX198_13020 [Methylococcaceae bacterium]